MHTWIEGDVAVDGTRLHYHRTGTSGKPALLLLHGVTDSGRVWTRVAGDLAADFDLVMTDARGHGQSSDLTHGFSIELLAEDAAHVITNLGLAQPAVWGHSMGAITAAALAAIYPALVGAVVLEDPPLPSPAVPMTGAARERAAAAPGAPDFRAMSAEERLAAAAALNPGWHPEELPPWAESKTQFDPAIAQYFGLFQSYPWRAILPQITCPALLLTGDTAAGALVSPATAQEARALLAHGQVAYIAGTGHNIHRDRYAETMRVVRTFLHGG